MVVVVVEEEEEEEGAGEGEMSEVECWCAGVMEGGDGGGRRVSL